MKKYEFDISTIFINKIFPEKRVKTKAQVIEILMETIRYFLLNPIVPEEKKAGTIILSIDKMSRLFFIKDNKYFSIVFPFYTFEKDSKFNFSFENKISITSQLISKVISIVQCAEFKEKCSFDFFTPIYEYEEKYDENFWTFLRDLLLMEDGYIRYDYDIVEFEKAKERGEEHIHPLNHYDLFYSNSASFKIGLEKELLQDEFIDLLNTKTDCKYLKN